MKLSIGFSPCPNDTYIFDALINNKIDTGGLQFDLHLADVEELNLMALNGELDITKLSYHALSQCVENYNLLSAGSALGRNCGPLLISKQEIKTEELSKAKIAIPGQWTTAHFLLKYFAPKVVEKPIYLFSEIEKAIDHEEVYAGVIIHENRFTYHERGFQLIQDLGQYWEEKTSHPIPLGGIAIKNDIDPKIQAMVNRLIQQSLHFARKQDVLANFVTQNAQEMEEEVMKQHINLYVNEFSLDLGEQGKGAVRYLLDTLQIKKPLKII